jgi:ABC-type amino acid transport substrate-binding protein
MSGIPVSPSALRRLRFTEPVLETFACFVVPDDQRQEFRKLDRLRQRKGVRIAAASARNPLYHSFIDWLKMTLPKAEIIETDSARVFYEDRSRRFDAAMASHESAIAWTLIHPNFTVVIPEGLQFAAPLAYPIADDDKFVEYVNQWLTTKRADGTIARLESYWVRGEGLQVREPRWSVIRDVLGWVD